MAEVIPDREFWRPPTVPSGGSGSHGAEACGRCSTEFMVGAKFCHVCGAERRLQASPAATWSGISDFLKVLEFQKLKESLSLSTPSLVAFFLGVGCALAALAVGLVYTHQTVDDVEAILMLRLQWLVGAIAAFSAGILLKKSGSDKS